MSKLLKNNLYNEDLNKIANLNFIPYEKLHNKSIFISGATGMIGSFFIDVIMKQNNERNLNCTILALGRNEERAKEKFEEYWNSQYFRFVKGDVNYPINIDNKEKINYVIHLASNTHPKAYATEPIVTIMNNIIGTQNLLELAVKHNSDRFVFASTCEIYGENRGDAEKFDEKYCGYIDCNTLRAGYPESKRCGEALCQAYMAEKNMDIVIPRLTRIYGPTMLMTDTKALSQFIKNGINKENIVLKSEGNQFFAYTYVADAVSGILAVMLNGESGEAYNIADDMSNIMLKDLVQIIADYVGKQVIFEIPDNIEQKGYSKQTKSILDGKKIKQIGWKSSYTIEDAVKRTINILYKEKTC